MTVSRGGISSLASGTAERALELALHHARTRDVYGGPIVQLGAIASHLADLEAANLIAAALSVKATALVNALGLAAAPLTAVAKLACCALAEEAVAHGRRVLGGRALLREHAFERLNGDVLLFGIFDGTSHVMLEQVQWDLAKQSVRTAEEAPLDELAKAYRAPPRELCSLRAPLNERPAARVRPFARPVLGHAKALAAVAGRDLSPVVALTEGLLAVVRELRRDGGPWERDQAVRFEAAEIYAGLEALFALIELADPERRAALGLPAAPLERPEAYPFALASFGARLASRVRRLAGSSGCAVDLGGVEERFLSGYSSTRAALAARHRGGAA